MYWSIPAYQNNVSYSSHVCGIERQDGSNITKHPNLPKSCYNPKVELFETQKDMFSAKQESSYSTVHKDEHTMGFNKDRGTEKIQIPIYTVPALLHISLWL